jgi:hypothetical protein
MDRLLAGERFEDCDEILERVDLDRAETNVLIGFLTITAPLGARLGARRRFFERVREKLHELRSPEDVNSLLRGLE